MAVAPREAVPSVAVRLEADAITEITAQSKCRWGPASRCITGPFTAPICTTPTCRTRAHASPSLARDQLIRARRFHRVNGLIGVTITYAGSQGTYPGLDQINVQLPASLAGLGVASVELGRIFHYRAKFLLDWTISTDLPQGGEGLWPHLAVLNFQSTRTLMGEDRAQEQQTGVILRRCLSAGRSCFSGSLA